MSGWGLFQAKRSTLYDALRIALAILLLSASRVRADQLADGPIAAPALASRIEAASTSHPELKDHRPSGPYCGVNSLFACLSALDIDTDPVGLISVDYVGSHEGSNVEQLIRATEHAGAKATCISHMTWSELQQATTPMILHTRESLAGREYDHWVAFLGMDGNRVRISDLPHPLQLYSMAELLANWDGTAVVISRGTATNALLWGARLNYLLAVGLLFLAVYSVRGILFRESVTGATNSLCAALKVQATEAGAILALSLIVAMGWHAVSEIGFFNSPTALAEVTRRYHSVEFPILTLQQTEDEINAGDALVLDARDTDDYCYGRLPGAKSMPIYASLPERQEVLADVPKSRRIIIYCQSANCHYADEIARFLNFNGYEDLAIYRQGYREWRDARFGKGIPLAKSPEANDAR